MPLCDVCQNIDIRIMLLLMAKRAKNRGFKYDSLDWHSPFPNDIDPYRHRINMADVQSHSSECSLCSLIWQGWLEVTSSGWFSNKSADRDDPSRPKNPFGPEFVEWKLSKVRDKPVYLRVLQYTSPQGSHHNKTLDALDPSPRLWASAGLNAKLSEMVELDLYTVVEGMPEVDTLDFDAPWLRMHDSTYHHREHDSKPTALSSTRGLSTGIFSKSGSPECLALARGWLQECLSQHKSCFRSQGGRFTLPTRVLVIESTKILLRVTNGEAGEWAALSYCWGGKSDLTLSQTTFPSLVSGLTVEEFPPTIRDAILTTQALGIKHIWVDALCIFQDSVSDWESEAPRMSEVYSQAVLTIIAASSPSTTSGIFHQRTSEPICKLPWKKSAATPEDLTGSENSFGGLLCALEYDIYVRGKAGFEYLPQKKNCHWVSRGWTFQEDMLSWRTLTYTDKQMAWRCSSCVRGENGHQRTGSFPQVDLSTPSFGKYLSRLFDTHAHQGPEDEWQVEAAGSSDLSDSDLSDSDLSDNQVGDILRTYWEWIGIVTEFSQRDLTYRSDRLPALAGLAKVVQDRIDQDTYCAGLWRYDLSSNILWTKNTGGHNHLNRREPFSLEYPSWSWIATTNAVYFPFRPDRGPVEKIAFVKDCKMVYKSSEKLGQITKGELIIEAPYYTSSRSRIQPSSRLSPWPQFQAWFEDKNAHATNFEYHEDYEEVHQQDELVIMQMAIQDRRKAEESSGKVLAAFLVLARIDNGLYGLPDDLESYHYYRRLCYLELELEFLQAADGTSWVEDLKWRGNRPFLVARELAEKPWPKGTFHIL